MNATKFEPADAWDILAEKLAEKLARMSDADADRELVIYALSDLLIH